MLIHCLAVRIVCVKKSVVLILVPLYITCLFFPLAAVKMFVFMAGFE